MLSVDTHQLGETDNVYEESSEVGLSTISIPATQGATYGLAESSSAGTKTCSATTSSPVDSAKIAVTQGQCNYVQAQITYMPYNGGAAVTVTAARSTVSSTVRAQTPMIVEQAATMVVGSTSRFIKWYDLAV